MTSSSEIQSGWNFYSLAIAAKNKAIGKMECEVILLEMSNFVDGELSDKGEREVFDYFDNNGVAKSGAGVNSQSVKATWYGKESNRITPPDVRRGEELLIYRYGNSEKFYWTTRNTNRHLRKLETVLWAFSGTKDEGDNEVNDENHYMVKLSTHQQQILLSTSKKNGEKCRWFIQVRPDTGQFIVADDNNNEVLIDSVQKLIRFINGDDTYVELNKKDINLKMVGNYSVNVDGNATVNVKGNASVKAATYTVSAGEITFNGKTLVNGEFIVNGNFTGMQGGSFAGHLKLPGGHSPPD